MVHLTGDAMASIRDNSLLSVAAVSTVTITLAVLAIVTLLALNMQHLGRYLNAQVQIVAYFQAGGGVSNTGVGGTCVTQPVAASTSGTAAASGAAVAAGTTASTGVPAAATGPTPGEQQTLQSIESLPGVQRVEFVGKEQALQALTSELGSGTVGGIGTDNPLPDAVNIFVSDPRLVASVAQQVQAMPGIACVENAQQYVNELFGFTQALRYVGIFLIAALALTACVVISNTVRVAVFARRDQIAIMKLVGATDGFIRLPFFIEGAVLGLLGALLSGGLIDWGYGWVQRRAQSDMPFLPLLTAHVVEGRLLEGLVLSGVLLGALGSAVSVRRHLQV